MEKDNALQLDWIDKLKESGTTILRTEIRLNKKNTINSILEKANVISKGGKSMQFTFQDLFKTEISRGVCLHFWDFVQQGIVSIVFDNKSIQDIYYKLLESGIKRGKALQMIGAMQVADGMRDIRTIAGNADARKIKALSPLISDNQSYIYSIFGRVQKALNIFKPVRIEDYVC